MKPDPWGQTLDPILAASPPGVRIVVPTPSGRPFTQAVAAGYAQRRNPLVFACGRYEESMSVSGSTTAHRCRWTSGRSVTTYSPAVRPPCL